MKCILFKKCICKDKIKRNVEIWLKIDQLALLSK